MITYILRAVAVMTLVCKLQFRWHDHILTAAMTLAYRFQFITIIYKLRGAAAIMSAYRLQFRWHDHILPESSSTNDVNIQIVVQMV